MSGAPKPSFSLGFDANDKGGRIASARPGAPQSASSAVAARNAAVPGKGMEEGDCHLFVIYEQAAGQIMR